MQNLVQFLIATDVVSFLPFGFEQPNIAILYFPYTLLPGYIVPLVLFSQLVSIRKLMQAEKVV
ncbi:MAG: hypothetical protein ABIO04_04715 [Ferruginibacter sp.]